MEQFNQFMASWLHF